jgi:hypothetical protein
MPETDFAAWEARLGFPTATETARVLGIDPVSVRRLRNGTHRPHPGVRRLMQVLEDNPEALRRLREENGR